MFKYPCLPPSACVEGLSFVIPAYNEAGAIAQTVARCQAVLNTIEGILGEVIVVDDCSVDGTGEAAAKAGARVLRHVQNAGYGRSLKDGILAASHDTIIILDGDGTYPVEMTPAMLEEYKKGFHLVVGRRQGQHYLQSLWKMTLRHILQRLTEFVAGQSIPDVNSGLRIFSRRELLPYFNHLCETFSFTTSQTLAYLMTGKFIRYVPIDYKMRVGSSKVRHCRDSMRTLQYIIQAIIYYNPIKGFMVLSGLMLAMAATCFLGAAVTGLTVAYFIGIAAVLVAMLTFSLGFVCELLRQILLDRAMDPEIAKTARCKNLIVD